MRCALMLPQAAISQADIAQQPATNGPCLPCTSQNVCLGARQTQLNEILLGLQLPQTGRGRLLDANLPSSCQLSRHLRAALDQGVPEPRISELIPFQLPSWLVQWCGQHVSLPKVHRVNMRHAGPLIRQQIPAKHRSNPATVMRAAALTSFWLLESWAPHICRRFTTGWPQTETTRRSFSSE